jgi:hypothetical protein
MVICQREGEQARDEKYMQEFLRVAESDGLRSMLMEHSDDCVHCRLGCDHSHDPNDPIEVEVKVVAELMAGLVTTPAVRGSRMRRGGAWTDPNSGLTIASDEWRQRRCPGCGVEAMTPVEMLPLGCPQDSDGAYFGWCHYCLGDIQAGHRPGHSGRRRRHRRA